MEGGFALSAKTITSVTEQSATDATSLKQNKTSMANPNTYLNEAVTMERALATILQWLKSNHS